MIARILNSLRECGSEAWHFFHHLFSHAAPPPQLHDAFSQWLRELETQNRLSGAPGMLQKLRRP
jgi:hypothetical protein